MDLLSGKAEAHLQMSFVLSPPLLETRLPHLVRRETEQVGRKKDEQRRMPLHTKEVCNSSFTFQISGSSVHSNRRFGALLPLRWVEAVNHLVFVATQQFVMSQRLLTKTKNAPLSMLTNPLEASNL